MTYSIEQTLHFQAAIFDLATPAYRRILVELFKYTCAVHDGNFTAVFPSIKTLARNSSCSATTVKKFIKRYKGIAFEVYKTKYRRSNHYSLDKKLFEFLYYIVHLRLDRCWNKVKNDIIKGVSEDENYLANRLYRKGHLSTTKVSTWIYSKVSTMNSYLKEIHLDKERIKKSTAFEQQKRQKEAVKEKNPLFDIPLSYEDQRKLNFYFSIEALQKARHDYYFYIESGNTIKTNAAFLFSRAKAHTQGRWT